jgi:hypothetical protein
MQKCANRLSIEILILSGPLPILYVKLAKSKYFRSDSGWITMKRRLPSEDMDIPVSRQFRARPRLLSG